LAFVAPHEDKEDSQSYYSENSEEEDMQSAYQLQYVEFLKLGEKYKQQVLELNNLRTEKTSMLIKINDLEDRLLETQLQLERVSDDKLTHMLSIQKCPTDKTGLEYVLTSISDTSSTFKTIFVRPVIPESPPPRMDKGKVIMEGEVPFNPQPLVKLPIRRKTPTCHHCGKLGHIRPNCPHWQVQQKKKGLAPKTPMCHQCGVSSHIRPRCPPPKPPKHHRSPPRNHVPKCWYSFRYGDVLPCDSLPSSMFVLLVICKITNGSSGVPTGPPLRCLSQFKLIFWRISVISRVQRICFLLIPGVVVLFIGSQFTVIKLLECLEHNLIRSLSPRSHSLESYLSN
jgi:hypothetical protein